MESLLYMSVVLNMVPFQRLCESLGDLWKEIKNLSDMFSISLLLGLITVTLVVFLTIKDSSGSCLSQQLRELKACFREKIFPDTFS